MRKAWNKKTTEQFVEQCKEVHNGYYTYDDLIYVNSATKVTVGCPKHGNFEITAQKHVQGQRCKSCASLSQGLLCRHSKEDFLKIATEVHGDKYDYTFVDLKTDSDVVEIICRKHSTSFFQTPSKHKQGHGCGTCGREAVVQGRRLTVAGFIESANSVHNNKYDYSGISEITGARDKVEIRCKAYGHGTFWISPSKHTQGRGCPKCSWEGSGYSQTKPGTFYILTCGNVTKVGITNRQVSTRIKGINKDSGLNFCLYSSFYSVDGAAPRNLELQVLLFLNFRYEKVKTKFDGYTECFEDVNIDDLLEFILPKTGELICQSTSLPSVFL